jgi:hypothetical protein
VSKTQTWRPLAAEKLAEITDRFEKIFPDQEYGTLARRICEYWIGMLESVWESKSRAQREKDLAYLPADPLSRIEQKTLVIAYPDGIQRPGEKSLTTLDTFLKRFFPAIRGIHMLPSCVVVEDRFNDGYFSQVRRNRIHERFGSNEQFSGLMERYFSMADFVLNHVDIRNPRFQAYLDGDDRAGESFFVFTETQYQEHLRNGDFAQVFRPRPFPLFTIFRRRPAEPSIASMGFEQRLGEMQRRLETAELPRAVIAILYLFNKVTNDQMLVEEEYRIILSFREYLQKHSEFDPESLFTLSETQEVQHIPYIFKPEIRSRVDLLKAIGFDPGLAGVYQQHDEEVFGPEIRALTTFSHVQVDLNTSTFEGLVMLAEDFSWYLSMDINMLRLDAANYAFKKWKTSCFGLPEVSHLMKILYLSIDAVSPRIVPNLEVNDKLSVVLKQMADTEAPPPMMYDFHLASILPLVFNSCKVSVLPRIFAMIDGYDIPKTSIRFSLAESHDGKSVRGSMDLLTLSERQSLVDVVEGNGGKIKYKSVPARQYSLPEFADVCEAVGIDPDQAGSVLFGKRSEDTGYLKTALETEQDIIAALELSGEQGDDGAMKFFLRKILHGREPYELCCSTRDSLLRLQDELLEAERYLAFYTLAFALMGRNVKSIYFNDLIARPNDFERFSQSGELRDLKRTKSDYHHLEALISDPNTLEHRIARGINDLIALVDSDPALHFRGNESEVLAPIEESTPGAVAVVQCSSDTHHSLVVVNVSKEQQSIVLDVEATGLARGKRLYDNIVGRELSRGEDGAIALTLDPFQRMWLSNGRVAVDKALLFSPV